MKVKIIPVLPYKGTSGWQGTDTSHQRALVADADGTTARRQQQVLATLEEAGPAGMTALELRNSWGETNPNKVSPACTVLHKEGLIVRLQERRGRHHVYVLPEYVDGRAEEPFVGRSS
jgi:hypothetical protein